MIERESAATEAAPIASTPNPHPPSKATTPSPRVPDRFEDVADLPPVRLTAEDRRRAGETARVLEREELTDLEPLRVEELAKLLGCNRKTVYEAAERGQIPGAFRVGRLLRFARPAVVSWLRQGAPSQHNTG